MSETYREQVRRVQMMAKGSPTWDLSDNDMTALTTVLEHLDAYAMEIAELRKDKARLDWLNTEDNPTDVIYMDDGLVINVQGQDVRAAINAAMEASK